MIASLKLRPGDRALDLACGSGDLALRLMDAAPRLQVIGGDYTFEMLRVAQFRSARLRLAPQWIHLDALMLPFQEGQFSAITMGYGLRNMADPMRALNEIHRVLKSGGSLVLLDFGKPSNAVLRGLYYFFLRTVQPALGWIFFQDSKTYRYIYESLMRYPAGEGVSRMLREAGFAIVKCENLCGGIMTLHSAKKA